MCSGNRETADNKSHAFVATASCLSPSQEKRVLSSSSLTYHLGPGARWHKMRARSYLKSVRLVAAYGRW